MKTTSMKNFLLSTVGSGLLIAVFILIAMIAIIAAQGRVINSDGSIEETSILRVNSIQKALRVKINSEEKLLKSERIDFIKSEPSTVEIFKESYQPWLKDINFKPSIVHDIYPFLIPREIVKENLISQDLPIDKVFFVDDSEFIFFTVTRSQKTSENGIWRYRVNEGRLNIVENIPFQVFQFNTSILDLLKAQDYSISFSPEQKSFVLKLIDSGDIWLGTINQNVASESVAVLLENSLKFRPSEVLWLREDRLLVRQNFNLFDYQISFEEINVINLSSSDDYKFTLTSSGLYFIRDSEPHLYKYNVESKRRTRINMPKNFIFPSKVNSIFSRYSVGDVFVLNTTQGAVYLNLKSSTPFFDIISDGEIDLLDISRDALKIIFRDNESTTKIMNFGEKKIGSSVPEYEAILNIPYSYTTINFLNNNYNIIIRAQDGNLYFADIDGENQKQLTVNGSILDYYFSKELRNIYFYSKESDKSSLSGAMLF